MIKGKIMAAMVFSIALTICQGFTALGSPGTAGSWQQDGQGRWYYYDENGTMCTGWIEIGGKYYYLYQDGHCAMNEITPDGYRVDGSGAWYEAKQEILGQEFTLPVRFQGTHTIGEGWGAAGAALEGAAARIAADSGGTRRLTIDNSGLEYCSPGGENKEDTWYLGLFKDRSTGGYRLDIYILLNRDSENRSAAEAMDHQVLKAMLTAVSSTPDQLEEAIYSSWQGDNAWGISRTAVTPVGDCGLTYEAGQGYGRYYLRPLP